MVCALATPPRCVLQTNDALSAELLSLGSALPSQDEDVHTQLQKVLLLTDMVHKSADPGTRGADLTALLRAEAPLRLMHSFQALGFEARKDAVSAFEALLALGCRADRPALVEHVRARAPEISHLMTQGIGNSEASSHYGLMLRACLRDADITSALLGAGCATELMRLAGDGARCGIDVSLEAFASLRALLLSQKAVAAAYTRDHFEDFFEEYHALLLSEDYATKRQALRLLGDMLLDRQFSSVMLVYACRERFLQLHMNLLRDASRTIQLDAFQVFKLFAANPHKPPRVQNILGRNAARLTQLLAGLAASKGGTHLKGDVQILTRAIEALACHPEPQR